MTWLYVRFFNQSAVSNTTLADLLLFVPAPLWSRVRFPRGTTERLIQYFSLSLISLSWVFKDGFDSGYQWCNGVSLSAASSGKETS